MTCPNRAELTRISRVKPTTIDVIKWRLAPIYCLIIGPYRASFEGDHRRPSELKSIDLFLVEFRSCRWRPTATSYAPARSSRSPPKMWSTSRARKLVHFRCPYVLFSRGTIFLGLIRKVGSNDPPFGVTTHTLKTLRLISFLFLLDRISFFCGKDRLGRTTPLLGSRPTHWEPCVWFRFSFTWRE